MITKATTGVLLAVFCALVLFLAPSLEGAERSFGVDLGVLSVLANPLPLALIWLALIWRRISPGELDLQIKRHWRRAVLIGLAFFVFKVLHAVFLEDLYEPLLTAAFGGDPAAHGEKYAHLRGDTASTLRMIGLVWLFAAFGEELFFRGLLLTQAERLLGGGRLATLAAVLFSSLVFGLIHLPVGTHQVVTSAISGVVFYAPAFLLARRNLVAPMLVHGLWNTFGLTLLYLGAA